MMIALAAAFAAAFPVNRHLIDNGKGHALTHHHTYTMPPTPMRLFTVQGVAPVGASAAG
jgi:hypothetical protein